MLLTLPYPPSANRYWRYVNGRVLVSKEARAYREEAGWLAKAQGIDILDGDISVFVHFYRPRRTGDLGNFTKILFDALNGIAWHDDKQIAEIYERRFEDKHNPRVEIDICPFTTE